MALTDEQTAAITRAVRARYAREIRADRKIFRQGIAACKRNPAKLGFVENEIVTFWSKTGVIDFDLIAENLAAAQETVGKMDEPPRVIFDTIQDSGSHSCAGCYCDCCGSYSPVATVVFMRWRFKSLKAIRGDYRCTLEWSLRDATWKIEKQAGGKDAIRWLNTIEKYSS